MEMIGFKTQVGVVEMTVDEALELQAQLSVSIRHALKHGMNSFSTSGVREVVNDPINGNEYGPGSLVIVVNRDNC